MNIFQPQQVQVSIIIVNYNTAILIRQCIASIRRWVKGIAYEIIVVDNDSTDDTLEMLEDLFQQDGIHLIANNSNKGFGQANNDGAEKANGKYLFFLNSDTYLLDDVVEVFYHYMENPRNAKVGCCGGDLVDEQRKKQVSYGNFPSLFETFSSLGFYKFYKSYYYKHLCTALKNDDNAIQEVDYLSGACMFFRTSVFSELGGFAKDFFLYFEETELAYRMKKLGYKSVLIPQAAVVHLEGGAYQENGRNNYSKIRFFENGRQLFFKKTRGTVTAFCVKALLALQALGRWVYHRDNHYLKVFRIIVVS